MLRSLKQIIVKIIYREDRDLLDNSFKRSQDYFIIQVIFATAFTIFTGGIFLTGFGVYLGVNDMLVGYLGLLPNICGIFLIGCGSILERFHNRKILVITLSLVSKSLICSIVLIPLLVSKNMQVYALIISVVIALTLQALSGIALNNWLISVVPDKIRGRYFSIRQTFSLIINIILSLAAGRFMDVMVNKFTGFLILFGLGMAMTIIEMFIFTKIKDQVPQKISERNFKFIDVLRLPLANKEFIRYIVYISVFFLILYISDSFTMVYMIRYLKLPYTSIIMMQMLMSVPQIFLLRVWGKISDKRGHHYILAASIWFFAGETLFLGLTNMKNVFIFIPIAFIFAAIANSGFIIGAFNRRYAIIPEKGRIIYDGFYNAITGVTFIAGPFIGGLIKSFLALNPFIQRYIIFGELRILYFSSTIGIIILQIVETRRKVRKQFEYS